MPVDSLNLVTGLVGPAAGAGGSCHSPHLGAEGHTRYKFTIGSWGGCSP